MNTMTEHIRDEVRVAMVRRHVTQGEIAERLGISRQHLSAMLSGRRSRLPDAWEKLLDELGLELVVRPRRAE
jgi:transcriptional regulator with XRE-family HTH domain